MKTITPFLLIAALTVGFNAAASQTIYKWTDSNGTVHFGKQPPPPGVSFSEIKTAKSKSPNNRQQESSTDNANTRDNGQLDKYDQQLQRLAKQQKEACNKAKANKERLLNNHRIQMRDADGNVRTLSHEEKLEQIQRADEGIQEYCQD